MRICWLCCSPAAAVSALVTVTLGEDLLVVLVSICCSSALVTVALGEDLLVVLVSSC